MVEARPVADHPEAGPVGARYAVLLVAYGAPGGLEDVEPYLRDVRQGRATPQPLVEEVRRRYAAIGGRSPLLERTVEQGRALAAALDGCPVYVGMRHWHPYIRETFGRMRADGVTRVVAIPLAPHFSNRSIGAYQQRIEEARGSVEVSVVRAWGEHPGFLDAVAARVRSALSRFAPDQRPEVPVVFTAHSLPRRILDDGDPYPREVEASARGVMERIADRPWLVAFQSAGQSDEPWLGPDAGSVLADLAAGGARGAVLCPIGFVSDHLEVLYDVDIEYQAVARRLGLRLERTASLNDSPRLIETLGDLVRTAARGRGWR